jgi:Uma2 family endonuclease
MATATSTPYLSVEEYLHTVYRPDVDYVDGRIEERNVGEFDHADLQTYIATLLRSRSKLGASAL